MDISRRDLMKAAGALAAAGSTFPAVAADCTASITPNSGSVMPRMPLEEFVQNTSLLDSLRRGVKEMKKRKPSDPLSWFFQAAIHGVQLDPNNLGYKFYKAALDQDPAVANVDRKYWNQCPHFGQHSADFLPWHRAYTFHFEQILRMHTGDSNFALPYWNYGPATNRRFPKSFGVEHLDGNVENDADENINPLFMKERDFYLTYYEHPLIPNMPLLELSDAVVDQSTVLAADVFFGDTEDTGVGGGTFDNNPLTRGLLESRPHDNIHRVVGGIIPGGAKVKDQNGQEVETDALGAMAQPPTAGFDPIFPLHHTNIDWIWAQWGCAPGKKWGNLPDASWFNERPWFFFDVNGNCVNEPRKSYFDHRALGVKFKYEDSSCVPLALPSFPIVVAGAGPGPAPRIKASRTIASVDSVVAASVTQNTPLVVPSRTLAALGSGAGPGPGKRLLLRVTITALNNLPTVGFDVHLTRSPVTGDLRRSDPSFLGSVHLFVHAHHGDEVSQDFTLADGSAIREPATVVFVPVALTQAVGSGKPNLQGPPLRIRKIEFLEQDR
ncbi:tyrosinase family protein [Bradyrhizobium elkanii]|uniref:tyrosinase family protein n=1 Tax=Bradyrhizobium elkanii TaxID=29448 RepID=UPI0004AF5C66|nr:tyrosinase family protein [Bradyrhizobium elkanii]WLA83248.1 tyrosinase family protein [Bradyrhizobium elkanii]